MSDSESDAPQAVSLSQSKKTARKQDKEVESFRAGEKKKEKERNRQRDLWLKEQASSKTIDADETIESKEGKKDKTGKRKKGNEAIEEDEEQKRLEARMARAMEEAGGEDDEEMDIGMDDGEEGDEDSDEDEDEDEDMEELDDDDEREDEDEEDGDEGEDDMEDDDDDASDPRSKYLPDHIFTAAFSKPLKPPSTTTPSKPPAPKASKASKKRKRVQSLSKDIVLGSRTIRTLPPPSSHTHADIHTPGTLAPPPRINKFLSRTLSLKGTSANKKKTQGWERRAANLGVMKRSGGAPAAGFLAARTLCARPSRRKMAATSGRHPTRSFNLALESQAGAPGQVVPRSYPIGVTFLHTSVVQRKPFPHPTNLSPSALMRRARSVDADLV
ncbi:uncharacterized protein STEHIDRAFT_113252 [Stereum hirsutum FP-91666 SS1]|uniref:uncharacterized protein n=1 Tax=Stereum hirsutum (strain FP-91666) TaxID=721885 RepID=UPI0004449951|nr:uncharacterized protein STEHIDRAFT_113252 [Stereum hirsutum FP-91666 SS1]EIM84045.1 hypothetical protein STEHIDRAFT_113252 [Stereum hirsutum FP-91666 SS1]